MTQAACRAENVPVKLRCLMTIWTIFVTLCYALQEDWWNNLLIRCRLSYTSHAHFIWVGYRYFRQKFPLLMNHGFTLVGKLLAKTPEYEA